MANLIQPKEAFDIKSKADWMGGQNVNDILIISLCTTPVGGFNTKVDLNSCSL